MTAAQLEKRKHRLCPNNIPRYVRCYDAGDVGERYTVVYTGNYRKAKFDYQYVGMNSNPFHPTYGVCQHGSYYAQIDVPRYGHLGKRIRFQDLPIDCRSCVLSDYYAIWNLGEFDHVAYLQTEKERING